MVRTECDHAAFQHHFFVRKHFPLERNICLLYTHYCESSTFISLEGGRSKDKVRLCHLSTSFQKGPHQKIFFDLKDKNYKKAKMKGGLGWMKKYKE